MSNLFIYFQWLQANGLKFYVPEDYFAAWASNLVIGKGLALFWRDITPWLLSVSCLDLDRLINLVLLKSLWTIFLFYFIFAASVLRFYVWIASFTLKIEVISFDRFGQLTLLTEW